MLSVVQTLKTIIRYILAIFLKFFKVGRGAPSPVLLTPFQTEMEVFVVFTCLVVHNPKYLEKNLRQQHIFAEADWWSSNTLVHKSNFTTSMTLSIDNVTGDVSSSGEDQVKYTARETVYG